VARTGPGAGARDALTGAPLTLPHTMWDDPDLYDLENSDDPEFDLGYWTRLIDARGARRVLELACGTGRLTVPLAERFAGAGVEFVGLDSSPTFLARARERADALGGAAAAAITLVEGDMREPPVEGPFDLVMVPFNSLAYLIEPADRLAALSAACNVLAPQGRFAFDLVVPRYDFLHEAMSPCPPVRCDADHAAPDQGVRRFLRTYIDVYEPQTQTLSSTNRYEIHRTDGQVEHRISDLDWHIYFPAELDSLLTQSGLEPVERIGGYEGEPWDARARRCLWVCAPA
jgi:SAM-dependent methyltransferase